MGPGKSFIVTALLVCLAVVNGRNLKPKFSSLLPPGETFVYDFYADFKAGVMESTPYASQYSLKGHFYITHHSSEPNIYIVALKNATTGRHNGRAAHFEKTSFYTSIPDVAKITQEPFFIFLSQSGTLKGVKVSKDEPVWSKNMKFAWASMFQLNWAKISFESPEKTQSFITSEKTIHGDCLTTYDVNPLYPRFNQTKTWVVNKFSSPMDCAKYKSHESEFLNSHTCPTRDEVNQ
ncbi:uncharacterized protein LOC130670550 [Microplitis mediator]|uniref:uncharacterized protein LOC130670550 n=1 Tax=Microplitis mediator TaxID=375433 RepID=UPI002553A933|nr:uncharacterized protein LOC130670550 [Microplitis mediator]